MDLHNKFENSPAVDFSILLSQSSGLLIDELLNSYDRELLNGNLNTNSLKSYHMLLCNEYQSNKLAKLPKSPNFSVSRLFSKLRNFSQEQFLVIYEIIILKLISDPTNVLEAFQEFQVKVIDKKPFEEKETRDLYMKIIECFLDAFSLLQFLNEKIVKPDLSLFISRDLETWYKNKDDSEWKTLVSLLPKIIKITDLKFLNLLWNLLQNQEDLKNSLTGLCIFINSSLETEKKENLSSFFPNESLWNIILTGLKSRFQLERKQALHLFKIVTELVQKQKKEKGNKGKVTKGEKVPKIPFTCDKNPESINLVRDYYILILESLEEKKQHMVLPSLSLLNYLTSANIQHQNCGNCFDISWLFCILEKILQHENNTVIKSGISYVLKMNPELFNDSFFKSLAKSLNNRFLYDREDNKNPPKIVEELKNLFTQVEELKVDLLSKFLSAIAEISWDPISIFYITFALSSTGENVHFSWKEDQLVNIKNLVKRNLQQHSPLLRRESQTNIIVAVTRFTREIDLKILANFLSAFPNDDETLSRGANCWEIILDWLQSNEIEESDVEKFINEFCTDIRDGFTVNVESFARVFVILYDLNFFKSNKCLINIVDLISYIESIGSRPYINLELTDRLLELIYHFVTLTNSSEMPCKIVYPYLDSALYFLLKSGKRSNLSYENVQRYSVILKSILKIVIISMSGETLLKCLEEEAIYPLQNVNSCSGLRRLYGINILQVYQEFRGYLNRNIVSLLLNVYTIPLIFEEEESLSGIKGKATTEYYLTVGKIVSLHLEQISAEISSENWFWHASTLFDKAGTSGMPFVIEILSIILKKRFISEKDLDEIQFLIRTCWKSILMGKKNRSFWTTYNKLLNLYLNHNCFRFEKSLVQEFVREILKEGDLAPNMKIEFLRILDTLESKWLFHFLEGILDCLLHGQVLRRDMKIELQTHIFLSETKSNEMKNQKAIWVDEDFYLNCNFDLEVRVRAIVLLFKAITLNEKYPSAIFPLVIDCLKRFKGKRYFSDSNAHRIQQRIYQVLLILEPVLNEDCLEKLKNEIMDSVILNTADQPSIQIMMSWILSRIYSRETDKSSLWSFFKEVKEKRPGNVKFVAGVILQISKLIKQGDKSLNNFLSTAISHLAPDCLGPTFNTRLACQTILVKLYERLQNKDNLYKAIVQTLSEQNFPIANEFLYDSFNPIDNYSLQSIYYEVPRLTNVSEDELIPPGVFKTLRFSASDKHPLKLLEESNSLSDCNPVSTKIKSTGKNEITSSDLASFDLQRKIVPQKSMTFEDQDADFNKKNLGNDTIIVVASLVECIPNLGGIARTCEVFGASELVLENKKCTEIKEFQSLSVTAEKWIKVSEVKPHELSKYLLEMKDAGWKLVGLEQTAYSSNLLETSFDRKTVLVLGNEKDGIPPHLIPILDTCVEIPQIGVIRSLNVHVTGAICIWEYAKQHFLREK